MGDAENSWFKSALGLAGWVLLCFMAASMGAFFSPGSWYAGLVKPSWNPPNWIFGPVWTVLYLLMAVAAWLVWRRGGFAARRVPLVLFLVQLALNAVWTPLFFGLQNPALGMIDIALLWLAVLLTILAFWKVRSIAGILLIPYILWLTFAGALNFTIWRLN